MADVGLSPGQPKILFYLTQHNDCMQKELAENCDVEPATISRIINNMEENGLIQRNVTKADRRAVTISITQKGRDAYKEWEKIFVEVEKLELEGFTETEKKEFQNYLERIYHNFTGHDFK